MVEASSAHEARREPDRIGGTPLRPVRIGIGDRSVRLWLKLEAGNPYGSVKARTARALLASLEASGRLVPGRRVVESTSGNLGLALAGLCAARGYRCTLVVESGTPRTSVDRMAAYGAEVITVPEVTGGRTIEARLAVVAEILAQDATAVWTNQYANPANPGVHESETAPELAGAAPEGGWDAVAVAVSTGGTLAGISRYFRRHLPATRIIAVDAVGSAALDGVAADRPFKLAGFGSGRRSAFVERHHWDHVTRLRDADAAEACTRIRDRTGISLGGSAGAVVLASVLRAVSDPAARELVCVCPDSAEKYARLHSGDFAGDGRPAEAVTEALALLDLARPDETRPRERARA
ncbi:cysteine synthase family protein [Streptomyces naphthomycinicus]|uniref:cysteine synthase family protein n=1 Tax=Streptomyces naphthomycinicus TaxID=2872625 RepID=UPI001CECDD41|nr:cysteine synthase family protein [Streptomyces sp. TML10]